MKVIQTTETLVDVPEYLSEAMRKETAINKVGRLDAGSIIGSTLGRGMKGQVNISAIVHERNYKSDSYKPNGKQ